MRNFEKDRELVRKLFIEEDISKENPIFIRYKGEVEFKDVTINDNHRFSDCAGPLDGEEYIDCIIIRIDSNPIDDYSGINIKMIDNHIFYNESGEDCTNYEEEIKESSCDCDLEGCTAIILYHDWDFFKPGDRYKYIAEIFTIKNN